MIVHLGFSLLLLATPATPTALNEAQLAWATAWADKPSLVAINDLGPLDGSSSDIENQLREHLRSLGRKTFSNREWKAYWKLQHSKAEKFADMLSKEGRAEHAATMRSWATLATQKLENQDIYLAAIEMERDAVERRLEAAVTQDTEKSAGAITKKQNLSPFQERQALIESLEQELKTQQNRTLNSKQVLVMVERQKQAAVQLLKAVQTDFKLAQTEAAIAQKQNQAENQEWLALWRPIAVASSSKAQKIHNAVRKGQNRIRSLDIEATLAESQMEYRRAKIADLDNQISASTSIQGWVDAILATAKKWLVESLWKVLLSLFGIWLLLRISLRLVGRLSNALRHVADDGDSDHMSPAEQRAGTIAAVFGGIAKVGVYAVAVLTALEVIGINTGPILGSVAILGLAVSFGSQNLVKDVVNGFFILIENQYAVGDVVSIGGKTGSVEKINLRSTRIRQYDGTLHVIPNGSIDSVANCTRDWARVVLSVGVAYDADLSLVEQVVNTVGQTLFDDPAFDGDLEEPPTYVGVVELADSSVNVRCIARTIPGAQWAISRELQRRIKDAFDEAGIEIPFPQRVMRTI